jgi:hypothetical protein
MSWSRSYSSLEDFRNRKPAFDASTPEENDQVEAAHKAAEAIIASGSAGAEGKDFFISLSGHTNPNHEPRPGYANDCISVTVSQKSPS